MYENKNQIKGFYGELKWKINFFFFKKNSYPLIYFYFLFLKFDG